MPIDPPSDAEETAALRQSLIDERAERAQAQKQASSAAEKIALWRDRAEKRAVRITTLEGERDQLRSVGGWLRAKAGRALHQAPPTPTVRVTAIQSLIRRRSQFPEISIASNAKGSLERIVEEANASSLSFGNWDAADLLVVDPTTLNEADEASLREWLLEPIRPPAAVLDDGSGTWGAANVLITTEPSDEASTLLLPESLEVTVPNPLCTPFTTSETEHVARRLAWQNRDPAVLLAELLRFAGVPHRENRTSVAGLLVSNRPDNIQEAVALFAAQTVPDKALIIGCHGFSAEPVRQAVAQQVPELKVSVLEFPSSMTLGECLNRAAESSTATVLAKIDDDDHYGPNYLLDALHALRYSGAEVVGKSTQFTYIEAEDRTVIRREEHEEMYMGSVLTGATLVFYRSTWAAVPFPHRPRKVDVYFVLGVLSEGRHVYANSRWEFVYRRNTSGHTWQADDSVFTEGASEAWAGWHPERSEL